MRGKSSGHSYDAVGNLLSDGAHSYNYDADGNLLGVDGGNTASYYYVALNNRTRVQTPSGTTEYAFDYMGKRVSSWNAANGFGFEGKIYWGSLPIAFRGSGATHFEQQDWLGTERIRTTWNGGVEGEYSSLMFGDAFTLNFGSDQDPYHFARLDHAGGHSVFYNMGQDLMAGPCQGVPGGSGPWSQSPSGLATAAIATGVHSAISAGGELTTLAGTTSTVGLTGAEYGLDKAGGRRRSVHGRCFRVCYWSRSLERGTWCDREHYRLESRSY